MKNLFSLALLFLPVSFVNAQYQLSKGTQIAGLQTTLAAGDGYATKLYWTTGSDHNGYGINLVPTYGYTLARNWVVGGTITLGYSREKYGQTFNNEIYHDYDLGLAPFTRLYLDLSKNGHFKLFGLASVEFVTTKETVNYSNSSVSYTWHNNFAAVGGGFAYFSNKLVFDLNVSGAGLRFGMYKTFGRMKR